MLSSPSSLHIIRQLLKTDVEKVIATDFVNNGVLHMFEEMRYELNRIEMYRFKNVGITTLIK